jgi:hypothetical protein
VDQRDQGEQVAGTAALAELLQLVRSPLVDISVVLVLTGSVGSFSGLACFLLAA